MRRKSGFSLIELVMVMVIISVGVVGVVPLLGNSAKSLTTNETVQQAAQYAQECVEGVLATRRNLGFTWFDTHEFTAAAFCPLINGFTRTVTLTPPYASSPNYYTGTSTSACPNLISCRDITIATTKGAISSSITVMLVNYQ